jgi:uncharacterized protein (TIRG00374 family)
MRRLVFILGILVSAICLIWLVERVNWKNVVETIRNAGPFAWISGSALYLLSFLPRALRWQWMLKPAKSLPLIEVAGGVVLGFAANNVLPFRLGEVVRAGAISGREKISNTTCLASIFAEKILDGLCLLLALFLSLHFLKISSTSNHLLAWLADGAALVFGIASLFVIVCICWEKQILTIVEKRISLAYEFLRKLINAFHFLKSKKLFVVTFLLSLAVWLIEGAVFAFFLRQMNVDQAAPRGFFCLAVVNLSILVPAAPGYLGVFQAGAAGAFVTLGLLKSDGVALSLLVQSAQFIPVTIAGVFIAPLFGLRWREMMKQK